MPRIARDVVFVDGVRTPFGKASPAGLYAETRADDMIVSVIRELLRRNPALPPERIGDVAVAATTQTGDQGLTIGRSAAVLAPPTPRSRAAWSTWGIIRWGPESTRTRGSSPSASSTPPRW